ncbi:P2R1A-PPP2R2A-interacting phosphatase regulator 1-like isoform X2 [Babylonia areolata]|uniref:P2R1A-PPP2R2A-interacting phosphatase regulator 1-like isoform X2 n=1 Tax=Babylonia areolata TaxID=304850 RepID=UPI003FD17391
MSQSASNMEVDPPSTSSGQNSQGGTLKRSNSAPMINLLVAASQSVEASPSSSFKNADAGRLRRLSSSNMGIHHASSTGQLPGPKATDRVNQIKHEENNITDRETAHEKEVHSSWQVTNFWDGLSLNNPDAMMTEPHRRPRSFSESLHIMTTPNLLCGSPSPPTRIVKQCFSPSMRVPVKNTTFTPSPSPSPTRKNFIRSLSPIATQTAPLKRKWESDGGDRYDYLSPPKKFHTGPSTPERNLPHPLAHSISSSSLEEGSPEQTVPRSCLPPQAPPPALSSHPHHPHHHTHHHHHHHHHHHNAHKEQPVPAFLPMTDLTDIHMTDSSENPHFGQHAEMSDMSAKHGLGDHHAGQGGGFTPIHPDRL